MSISSDFSEAGRFSGRELPVRGGGGGGGGQEKSNFSQTCSLLSQYLKENGSFGDLSLGMNCSSSSSNNVEGKPETFRQTPTPIRTVKSMDLFPEHAGFGGASASVPAMETVTKKADFSTTLPETAQMTIFYAGKVHVFDNFSMEKAKELMMLASKASCSGNDRQNTVAVGNIMTQELPQRIASVIPIARKASLHRFLEKRKDRINSRAPYQINQNSSSASIPDKAAPITVENKTWLGLAPQSRNPFELQL